MELIMKYDNYLIYEVNILIQFINNSFYLTIITNLNLLLNRKLLLSIITKNDILFGINIFKLRMDKKVV